MSKMRIFITLEIVTLLFYDASRSLDTAVFNYRNKNSISGLSFQEESYSPLVRPRFLPWLTDSYNPNRFHARGLLIALMMEAARTSETLVNFYRTTRRYNPEDSHLRVIFSVFTILSTKRHSTVILDTSMFSTQNNQLIFPELSLQEGHFYVYYFFNHAPLYKLFGHPCV
jgi:hypothetical protein